MGRRRRYWWYVWLSSRFRQWMPVRLWPTCVLSAGICARYWANGTNSRRATFTGTIGTGTSSMGSPNWRPSWYFSQRRPKSGVLGEFPSWSAKGLLDTWLFCCHGELWCYVSWKTKHFAQLSPARRNKWLAAWLLATSESVSSGMQRLWAAPTRMDQVKAEAQEIQEVAQIYRRNEWKWSRYRKRLPNDNNVSTPKRQWTRYLDDRTEISPNFHMAGQENDPFPCIRHRHSGRKLFQVSSMGFRCSCHHPKRAVPHFLLQGGRNLALGTSHPHQI